jgi:hypothetical protein
VTSAASLSFSERTALDTPTPFCPNFRGEGDGENSLGLVVAAMAARFSMPSARGSIVVSVYVQSVMRRLFASASDAGRSPCEVGWPAVATVTAAVRLSLSQPARQLRRGSTGRGLTKRGQPWPRLPQAARQRVEKNMEQLCCCFLDDFHPQPFWLNPFWVRDSPGTNVVRFKNMSFTTVGCHGIGC